VTVQPGRGFPSLSTTFPVIDPVSFCWASAFITKPTKRKAISKI
jgi:hypothetical protein